MRAKCVNENIRFEKGQEPRKSMGIGLSLQDKILQAVKEVAKSHSFADEVEVYDEDPNTFTAGFHYRNAILSISIEPDYENDDEGWIYSAGMEDDGFPSSEYNEYNTLEEEKERMDDWCDIIDENIEEQGSHCPECGGELEGDWCDNCDGEDYEEEDIDESIKFERGQDPKRPLDIGEDRTRSPEELIKLGTEKIYPEILEWLESIGALNKYGLTKYDVRNEVEELLETIITMWDLKRLSDIKAGIFKEYWKDIHAE